MNKYKQIGLVQMNLNFYKGQDCYTDGGEIEDGLLEIAKRYREDELNDVIAEKRDWAVMYHFSHIRQNVIDILDIDSDMSVLEIGAGCGAVTGALAEKAKRVTCVELSEKRSLINAYRNQAHGNVEILVGNFQDIEASLGQYDCITLIGVFEYANAYIDSDDPDADFLKIIRKHLTPKGKIVIAIENKLGLKYFAGCTEDHFGLYFEGIEGYSNTEGIRTYARNELKTLVESAGFPETTFFYPYPDYKMTTKIYSDAYLPLVGELNTNLQNFDRERMLFFDESKVFNSLIKEGLFAEYANSFLLEAKMQPEEAKQETAVYEKISNDRAEEFSICTTIVKDVRGNFQVIKRPASAKSLAHIRNIEKWSKPLAAQFEKSKIFVCESRLEENQVRCPFITGMTLEEIADRYIQSGEVKKAEALIREYLGEIIRCNSGEAFVKTPDFVKVFGDVRLKGSYRTGKVNNIDMVLNNALNTPRGWTLIDYEWTFDFPVPVEFILYRIMHYYLETNNSRNMLRSVKFFEMDPADLDAFAQMERNFQKYVRGSRHLMRELYSDFGKPAVYMPTLMDNSRRIVLAYRDRGAGYHEEDKLLLPVFMNENKVYTVKFTVEPGVARYRIDPCETACILKIVSLQKEDGIDVAFHTNGTCIGDDIYICDADPWLEVRVDDTVIKELQLRFSLETNIPECGRIITEGLALQQQYKEVQMQNEQLRQQLEEANLQLDSLAREREAMMNSRSWKLTKPLREVKRGLEKCRQNQD